MNEKSFCTSACPYFRWDSLVKTNNDHSSNNERADAAVVITIAIELIGLDEACRLAQIDY